MRCGAEHVRTVYLDFALLQGDIIRMNAAATDLCASYQTRSPVRRTCCVTTSSKWTRPFLVGLWRLRSLLVSCSPFL